MTCPFFFYKDGQTLLWPAHSDGKPRPQGNKDGFMKDIALIILAAGEGTRMKSRRAKVLHEVAGIPMIRHVVDTALAVAEVVVVVVGYQGDDVRKALDAYPALRFAMQREQLGTGHAVACAVPQIPAGVRDVVVLCGDTPLIKPETVLSLVAKHRAQKRPLSLITTRVENPFGYGRIVLNGEGEAMCIVEEADASEEQKSIRLVNTGAYCVNLTFLREALESLDNDNVQGEFYLTDVVAQAYREDRPAVLLEVDEAVEVMGVNTREELARADHFVLQVGRADPPESS